MKPLKRIYDRPSEKHPKRCKCKTCRTPINGVPVIPFLNKCTIMDIKASDVMCQPGSFKDSDRIIAPYDIKKAITFDG